MTTGMRLIDRIEAELADLRLAAKHAAGHNLMTSATRLQGKADGLRWVLKTMAEVRQTEDRETEDRREETEVGA